MRTVLILVQLSFALIAQGTLDEQIREEHQTVMELLTPPTGATQVDEEAAQKRAETFRARLKSFCDSWLPRADKLKGGRFILGRALAQSGRLAEASTQLEQYLKAFPTGDDAEEATLTLATAHLDLGREASSERLLRRFLGEHAKSPKAPVASYYLALAVHAQGKLEEALGILRAALPEIEAPLSDDANLKLLDFLRDAGRIEAARKHLNALLRKNPDAAWLQSVKEQLDWLGKRAPLITNVNSWVLGPKTRLEDLRGQVVVMVFFADFYEASRRELANLGALAKTLDGQGVRFLGLTKFYRPQDRVPRSAQEEIVRKTMKDAGASFTVGIGDDFANHRAYGVRGIPWTVVIDKKGHIAHIAYGASQKQRGSALEAAIKRAQAAK